MRTVLNIFFQTVLGLFLWTSPAFCRGNNDIFDFFRSEAEAVRVVTGSRLPYSVRWAPATVYVITADDIAASGARTLWDALRSVPGVDVMATRSYYGEVSIRGLNKALNNRTLVLLDGKTVLNGPLDATDWDGIPVTLAEVDRIEVVEGPASALYGANAVNGVINIITKAPERLGRGVDITAGELDTYQGSLVYGDPRGGYKVAVGAGSTNRFENDDLTASRVGKAHAFARYRLPGNARLSVSGGLSVHEDQVSMGTIGPGYFDATTGFVRADFERGDTRLHAFWNAGSQKLKISEFSQTPHATSQVGEVNVEHTLELPLRNRLVVGGSYRANAIRSNSYSKAHVFQNLWAVFLEDAWGPGKMWSFVTSARLDRHPLSGWVFSPRGSLVFSPTPRQVFRISAGGSFRNPTLTESYLAIRQTYGSPEGVPVTVEFVGNTKLKPERLVMVEAAYAGRFGPARMSLTGFHYQLKDIITQVSEANGLDPGPPPQVEMKSRYQNLKGTTQAWGGEAGAEVAVNRYCTVFANYSYQRFSGQMDPNASTNGGPSHKVNGGVRMQSGGFSAEVQAHWVGDTFWSTFGPPIGIDQNVRLDGYFLLNAHVGYAFSNRLKGLELSVQAFNLADHKHAEILGPISATDLGQGGEILGRRVTATVSYRFH